jgi:uncharacterized membrane protein
MLSALFGYGDSSTADSAISAFEPPTKGRIMIPPQHIHPLIVHFPIVLVVLLVAFDWIASARGVSVTGRTPAGNASAAFAVLAGLAALTAFYFGGVALTIAESGGFHSEVAEVHESLGEMTAIILACWAVVRAFLWLRDVRITSPIAFSVPVLELAGLGLVTATAYYGGQLVYDLGVNVAVAAG